MATNKIIATAREAGFNASNGFSLLIVRHSNGSWIDIADELARFYAIARAEALEDAAQACRPFGKTGAVVAAAIKALKEQQHG